MLVLVQTPLTYLGRLFLRIANGSTTSPRRIHKHAMVSGSETQHSGPLAIQPSIRKAAPAKLSNTMDRDTRDSTPEKHSKTPTPSTGTAREKEGAQTEESLRHNGLLSLPTVANPDNYKRQSLLI